MMIGNASVKFEIIQKTLQDPDCVISVSELCKIAGVSRSGYYNWIASASIRDEREAKDRADFDLILTAYNEDGYTKGARGIYMALLHMNPIVIMNLKKIRRLMSKYQLYCPIRKANPYRRMAKAMKSNNYVDNILQREFKCFGPRTILLTDITYIPYNGTFAYLSTILDAYTKQVLSYVVSKSLEVDFVKRTVELLVENHGVSLHTNTLIHSDQGSHYTSIAFIEVVTNSGLRRSMSRRGNCWDNAPQESFFGHMKDHVKPRIKECSAFDFIRSEIDKYIDHYNNRRYQWNLAKLSPNEFYEFITTGIYPLAIPNPPTVPIPPKDIVEIGIEVE